MVKFVVFVLVVSLFVSVVLGAPLSETEEEGTIRQKRVTCDVLSAEAGGVAINHSVCALHCLALGKKGGSCKGGVCVCRN